MVERVTGDRQSPAFDRVGEHDRRARRSLIALGEGVEQHAEVVTAEIGDEGLELVVVEVTGEPRDRLVGAVEKAGP